MVNQRLYFFTIARKLIDLAAPAIARCTIIFFVFIRPAACVRAEKCRALLSTLDGTLDMLPAGDQRLDAADAFDRNLVVIDCGPYAFDSFDIRIGKDPLAVVGLDGKD